MRQHDPEASQGLGGHTGAKLGDVTLKIGADEVVTPNILVSRGFAPKEGCRRMGSGLDFLNRRASDASFRILNRSNLLARP
jgi:hypothetical protein